MRTWKGLAFEVALTIGLPSSCSTFVSVLLLPFVFRLRLPSSFVRIIIITTIKEEHPEKDDMEP